MFEFLGSVPSVDCHQSRYEYCFLCGARFCSPCRDSRPRRVVSRHFCVLGPPGSLPLFPSLHDETLFSFNPVLPSVMSIRNTPSFS